MSRYQSPVLTSLNNEGVNVLSQHEISSEFYMHEVSSYRLSNNALDAYSPTSFTPTQKYKLLSHHQANTKLNNSKEILNNSREILNNSKDIINISRFSTPRESNRSLNTSAMPVLMHTLAPKETIMDILLMPVKYVQSKFSAGSVKGSILTLISTTIGGGVLGFPKSLEAAGLGFGIFLTILAALIAYYSTRLLVKASIKSGLYSYSRIALMAYGKKAEIFVKFTLFFFFWGVCVYYNILLNEEIITLIKQFWPNGPEYMKYWYFWPPIYTTLFILPMNLPKELKSLRYFCLVKFGVILFIVYVVIYEMFNPIISDLNKNENIKIINLPGISSSFPNILFSFMCHANVLDVFRELKGSTERRMAKVLRRGVSLTALIYLSVGITGFLTFSNLANYNNLVNGDKFPASILTGPYNGEQIVTVASFLVGITLLVAGALNGKPAKDSLRDFFFPFDINNPSSEKNIDSTQRHVVLVIVNVYSQMLLAMFFQNITLFIDFLGSTAAPFIFFIFPSFFYLKLDDSPKWSLNRIVCWILNIFMIIFAIYSTIQAVENLIAGLSQDTQY